MRPTETSPPAGELDDFIRAYEEARTRGERLPLTAFLPEPSHPFYVAVLREVIRTDLEYGWDGGQPRPLDDYCRAFPELVRDPESLQAITFEEYRLRRQAGEEVLPAEYQRRFGVEVTSWPSLPLGGTGGDPTESAASPESPAGLDPWLGSALLAEAALAYQDWYQSQAEGQSGAGRSPSAEFQGSPEHAAVFDELHLLDPGAAVELARALTTMPRVGGEFLGFALLAELGRGAFGRVYLARQGDLADRLVVLKIVPHLSGESRTLAQLQHTHIVPIYSVHRADPFQAVCMPFFGTTTLADILKDLRSRPALPASGTYLLDRIEARATELMGAWGSPCGGPDRSRQAHNRAPLENLTYAEGILWLAARLADGLDHAHGRGILHRDLKPANILLTDEGQPMLLDFNLSEDTKLDHSAAAARIGGTLPYLAPEQLQALQNGTHPGDQRSDLYSFGIILYELLTGRHPFPQPHGPMGTVLREMRADRGRIPDLRRGNPAVSPGAASIVRHCLEPEPSRRYQTARELHEDLLRQLEHRPLKYAAEPSLWERARKWTRRHPRLSSSSGVAILAALLILALAGAFLARGRHLARLRAEQQRQETQQRALDALRRLRGDLKTIEILLGSDIPDLEQEQREEGMALAQGVLAGYRVLESPAWQETPLVRALAPEQQEQLREDMVELLLLLAGAEARRAQLELAMRLNALAIGCYPAERVPRALWHQRAELARSAGYAAEAQDSRERAEQTPAQAPRDRYLLLLTEYRYQGRLPEAVPLLRELTHSQQDNFAVWLFLGHSYRDLGEPAEAMGCYEVASALWPESHWPYLFRGLACLEQGDFRQARVAFDEVIRLRPDVRAAYYNRALARFRLGELTGARADLTHLLNQPKPPLRAYFLRARVRAREGDRPGAQRDQEEGLRAEPVDERDWTARGLARQPRDPRAALADYESALRLNPRYRTALQNKANVLAENLGRTEDAIAVLDKLLALYPQDVPARAGRGVLQARLGRREAALADAREALRRDARPFNTYQVAGIYALTSRQHPDDRREAFRLLRSALDQGFRSDLLDRDRDLDALRDQPEFRQLVAAAQTRRGGGIPQGAKPPADALRR